MLDVFLTVILPVFLVAAAGASLQRWLNLSIGALSPITVYLLSPALVFRFLLDAELPAGTSGKVVAASLLTTLLMLAFGLGVSLLLRQTRQLRSGFLLATGFPNAGNMGLPTTLLAYGEPGLAVAIVMFITQGAISWPVGIFIAARSRARGLAPLIAALKMPTIYALLAAIFVRVSGWELPTAIEVPVGLLADAALPLMLLILGFQLAGGIEMARWRSLLAALSIRLVAAAPIAYAVTWLLGIGGVAQQVLVTVSAMPAAVFTTLLATQFDAEPRYVSSAVVTGTLASLASLTIVITSAQRWLGG